MIIIPKHNRVELSDNFRSPQSEVEGWWHFRIGKKQADGTLGQVREYSFPNLITNQGLDRMGTNTGYISYCQVGTGTATPAVTDTQLQAPIAGAGNTTNAGAVVIGPPRYAYSRRTYRFEAGVGTGNLTEVAASWSSGTGATVFNRALIVDGGGNPIAVTKLADEVLDVTYELRTYIPLVDVTGNVVITGSGTHDYIIRACDADQVKPQYSPGWGPRRYSGNHTDGSADILAANQGNGAYTGDIANIDGAPTGSAGVSPSVSSIAYVPGSYERQIKHSYGLGGNPIRSIIYSVGWASWQIQFDPVIPKGAGNNFVVEFIHSWARRSI